MIINILLILAGVSLVAFLIRFFSEPILLKKESEYREKYKHGYGRRYKYYYIFYICVNFVLLLPGLPWWFLQLHEIIDSLLEGTKGKPLPVRKTYSLLGTGIRPLYLESPVRRNSALFLNMLCPFCKKQISAIPQLTRDFLSILYMPIFPLGRSAVVSCGECSKIFRLSYNELTYNLGGKGTWIVPALFSFLGALVGWILASELPGLIVTLLFGALFGWYILGELNDIAWTFGYRNAHWLGLISGTALASILALVSPLSLNAAGRSVLGVLLGMGALSCVFLSLFVPVYRIFYD